MTHRVFNIASLISATLFAGTVLLCVVAFFSNPWDHHVSLGDRLHIGVWRGFSGATLGRIVFFNDAEYGPYRGSIIQLSDENGNLFPPLDRKILLGDSFGVYYRYFRWPEGSTLWTLMLSLWYPLIPFSLLPSLWLWRRSRFARGRRPIQFGIRTLMATAWAVGGLCWIGMRAGRDIFDLGVGDLLQMTGLFAVGAAAAWAVSAFVLPRWVGGWTLHLARGGVFGVLAAPAMIDGRCAAGTIPVPGYTLFLFAPGQLLAEPLAAIEVIGPGFVFVAVLATMLSASIAGRPNA